MSHKAIVFLNTISLVLTIIVNYLLNTGLINGTTMKTISDNYYNLFTPAGYAFAIWGLIYTLLIIHCIYNIYIIIKTNQSSIINAIGLLFFFTNIINCLWVYFWLNNAIEVCLVLMILLLVLLVKIVLRLQPFIQNSSMNSFVNVAPFTIYTGWISVALIANSAVFLTKINWQPVFLNNVGYTLLLIVIAFMIGVYGTLKYKISGFGTAIAWGLIAVSVSNFNKNLNIAVVALVVSIILLTISILTLKSVFSKQN